MLLKINQLSIDEKRRRRYYCDMAHPAVQALLDYLENAYNTKPTLGRHDGKATATIKPEGAKRMYVSLTDEFIEDYPAHEQEFQRYFAGLSAGLAQSETKAMMVTTMGLKECSRPEILHPF